MVKTRCNIALSSSYYRIFTTLVSLFPVFTIVLLSFTFHINTFKCDGSKVIPYFPDDQINITNKEHNSCKNEFNLNLSSLFAHIPFLIVNIYFEFQVYMFSNNRDMTKNIHIFCTTTTMPRL